MPSGRNDCRPWLQLYSLNFPQLARESFKASGSEELSPSGGEDVSAVEPKFDFWKLPSEVINKILSFLHAEQLSILAQVCKGWRTYVYEPRHWKLLAFRAWPRESCRQLERRLYDYKTWRRMVTLRPRVRTNGIYIVRCQFPKTSIRGVAAEAGDPVFLVTYHRLFRFFWDGSVVALTTPERLDVAYQRLKKRWNPAPNERDKAHPSTGQYEFNEESGTVTVTMPMTQAKYPNMREGTQFFHFTIGGTVAGACNMLNLRDHYGITDLETGEVVSFIASSQWKVLRFVSIWGFRNEVFKSFPPDEPQLARWSSHAMSTAAQS